MLSFQINNPDKRVVILKEYALDRSKFKQDTPLLDYAMKVEQITTAKVNWLFFQLYVIQIVCLWIST